MNLYAYDYYSLFTPTFTTKYNVLVGGLLIIATRLRVERTRQLWHATVLEEGNLDIKPDQLEGVNLDIKPDQMEGVNLDIKPDQMEGVNLDIKPDQMEGVNEKNSP